MTLMLLLCFMFLILFSKFDFVFGNELKNSQIRFEYWFCEDGMQVGRKWTFRFDDCIPQFVPIILVTIAIEDQVVGVYNCIRRAELTGRHLAMVPQVKRIQAIHRLVANENEVVIRTPE
uniref:Uncharacterized protein n=1 Tax=Rhodnius prolixus TaxID=13249 RepID=T1HY53_RHOPR